MLIYMLKDRIIKAVQDAGFDEYALIEAEEIIFSEDVFKSCAQNTCINVNLKVSHFYSKRLLESEPPKKYSE